MLAELSVVLEEVSGFWDKLTDPWSIVGFFGQAMFFSRFVVQWIASEREKRSVVPVAFWWLSIAGSLIVLVYAIHRVDPVFIVGYCCGFIIYSRNLYLIRAERLRAARNT